jgi:hypothetical protein
MNVTRRAKTGAKWYRIKSLNKLGELAVFNGRRFRNMAKMEAIRVNLVESTYNFKM